MLQLPVLWALILPNVILIIKTVHVTRHPNKLPDVQIGSMEQSANYRCYTEFFKTSPPTHIDWTLPSLQPNSNLIPP